MSNHLFAVGTCWLVAGCGLAMFLRATTAKGKAAGYVPVIVAMLLLSAMALDRGPEHADGPYFSSVGGDTYHAAGCPLMRQRDVIFRCSDEAVWAGKRACTYCLLQQASYYPQKDH